MLLLAATLPAGAHHSFAAEFDAAKPVVLRGTITRVDWSNPHVYVWIDAVDTGGAAVNWRIESAAPNYLRSLGWSKNTLKPGDAAVIQGYASKDQPYLAKMDAITLPGGAHLTVGH